MERKGYKKVKFLVDPPGIIKTVYSNFIWNAKNNKVLLTFDDGPISQNTDKILNKLSNYNIKATFFCVGNNIKRNISLASEILSEGHSIGNHCYNHKIVMFKTKEEISKELASVNILVKEELNYEIKYFRPPHGRFGFNLNNVLDQLDMKCCMWSLLTYDYENNFNKSKDIIEKYIKNNSIVVLHDSIKSSHIILNLIDVIVEVVANNNYEIGSPDECL